MSRRYIVVGVGAIGGTVAGKLWSTGCEVACCARGESHTVPRLTLPAASTDRPGADVSSDPLTAPCLA